MDADDTFLAIFRMLSGNVHAKSYMNERERNYEIIRSKQLGLNTSCIVSCDFSCYLRNTVVL